MSSNLEIRPGDQQKELVAVKEIQIKVEWERGVCNVVTLLFLLQCNGIK